MHRRSSRRRYPYGKLRRLTDRPMHYEIRISQPFCPTGKKFIHPLNIPRIMLADPMEAQ